MLKTKEVILNNYVGAMYKDLIRIRGEADRFKYLSIEKGGPELYKASVLDDQSGELQQIAIKLEEYFRGPVDSIDFTNSLLDRLNCWEENICHLSVAGQVEDVREILDIPLLIDVIMPRMIHIMLHMELHKCSSLFVMLQNCALMILGKALPEIINASFQVFFEPDVPDYFEWHRKFLDHYNATEVMSESEVHMEFKLNSEQVVFNDEERAQREADAKAEADRVRKEKELEEQAAYAEIDADSLLKAKWPEKMPMSDALKRSAASIASVTDCVNVAMTAKFLGGMLKSLGLDDYKSASGPEKFTAVLNGLHNFFCEERKQTLYYTMVIGGTTLQPSDLKVALTMLPFLTAVDVVTKEELLDTFQYTEGATINVAITLA